MKAHEFRLYLSGVEVATVDIGERLVEAGCDDGTFGSCNGAAFIEFDREARSLDDAIVSAIRDVRSAGLEVDRVTTDEAETVARFNSHLAGA